LNRQAAKAAKETAKKSKEEQRRARFKTTVMKTEIQL